MLAALGALSLGILLGLLVSLSRTPVVHDVVVAVLAAGLAFAGLEQVDGALGRILSSLWGPSGHKKERGALGPLLLSIGTIVGLVAGMWLRQCDPIGNAAIKRRFDAWHDVDPERAVRLVEQEFFEGRAGLGSEGVLAEKEKKDDAPAVRDSNEPGINGGVGLVGDRAKPGAACQEIRQRLTPGLTEAAEAKTTSEIMNGYPELKNLLAFVADDSGVLPPARAESVANALKSLCSAKPLDPAP
ncbi:MAG TPA: hypothetical protein VH062_00555 [Polyangiaceae bacterium]|nr:hypothetical protein [Polyangiaceae bacterium]